MVKSSKTEWSRQGLRLYCHGLHLNVHWDSTSGSAFHPTPTLLLPAAVSCLLFSFLLTHFYCLPLAQSVWSGHKALSLLIATVGQETPHTNTHTKERERKIIKKRRLREEAGMIFITQNLGRVNVFQCSCWYNNWVSTLLQNQYA